MDLAHWLEAHYASTFKRLVGLCYGLLGNEPDAEDAAQYAILEAFRQSAEFRGECAPLTYLITIAKRHCWAKVSQRRQELLLIDEETPEAFAVQNRHSVPGEQEQEWTNVETRKLLRRAIRRMKHPRRRQIARLIWVLGRNDEQVMRILGVSDTVLRLEKSRAKQTLVEIFSRIEHWRRPVLGDCVRCGEPARVRCYAGLVCLACNSIVHGAIQALLETRANQKPHQAQPCWYCGKPWKPLRRGRCEACYQRWKKNDFIDRPTTRRPGYGQCACGCGTKMSRKESRRGCIYRPDHAPRRQCACGCGTEIPQFDVRGRERRFYPRHGRRGASDKLENLRSIGTGKGS